MSSPPDVCLGRARCPAVLLAAVIWPWPGLAQPLLRPPRPVPLDVLAALREQRQSFRQRIMFYHREPEAWHTLTRHIGHAVMDRFDREMSLSPENVEAAGRLLHRQMEAHRRLDGAIEPWVIEELARLRERPREMAGLLPFRRAMFLTGDEAGILERRGVPVVHAVDREAAGAVGDQRLPMRARIEGLARVIEHLLDRARVAPGATPSPSVRAPAHPPWGLATATASIEASEAPPAPGPPRGTVEARRQGGSPWPLAVLLALVAGAGVAAARLIRWPGPLAPAPPAAGPATSDLAMGLALLRKGNIDRAVARFQVSIRGDPGRADEARAYLIVAILRQRKVEIAREEMMGLTADRLPSEALYELADACETAGLTHEAQRMFGRVYARDITFRDIKRRVRSSPPPPSRPDATPGPPSTSLGDTPTRARPPPAARPADGSVAPATPDATAPGLPERYTNTVIVGRGGMGVVLAAWDSHLERRVAIKLLAPELRHELVCVERFHREARAIARVSNPHVVQIYDVQDAPVPFFTMELLEGQSLTEYLRQRPGVDLDEALGIGLQVARALEALHAMGLVHRDVKPGNIIRMADGHVKLVDFGLVRDPDQPGLTRPLVPIGTALYMAPEQIGGRTVDARADIFALGIVLFELVAGHYPYPRDVTFPQLWAPVPSLAGSIDGVSPVLSDLLVRCTHTRLEDRIESAAAVIEVLAGERAASGRSRPRAPAAKPS